MQEGYKLVRYIADGHTAERKAHIADRLLRKGLVEIIEAPKARVLESPFMQKEEDDDGEVDERLPDIEGKKESGNPTGNSREWIEQLLAEEKAREAAGNAVQQNEENPQETQAANNEAKPDIVNTNKAGPGNAQNNAGKHKPWDKRK